MEHDIAVLIDNEPSDGTRLVVEYEAGQTVIERDDATSSDWRAHANYPGGRDQRWYKVDNRENGPFTLEQLVRGAASVRSA